MNAMKIFLIFGFVLTTIGMIYFFPMAYAPDNEIDIDRALFSIRGQFPMTNFLLLLILWKLYKNDK